MNEITNHSTERRVTLYEFSKAVGCHFTTASRLRSGDRMPGGKILREIVKKYNLNPLETLEKYGTEDPKVFGRFLREQVFHVTEEDLINDKQGSGSFVHQAA